MSAVPDSDQNKADCIKASEQALSDLNQLRLQIEKRIEAQKLQHEALLNQGTPLKPVRHLMNYSFFLSS